MLVLSQAMAQVVVQRQLEHGGAVDAVAVREALQTGKEFIVAAECEHVGVCHGSRMLAWASLFLKKG